MAQLKWLIWMALIVIIIKMYDKGSLRSGSIVDKEDEIVKMDTSVVIQKDSINSEDQLLKVAHQNLFQYYKHHFDSIQSDSFTYTFSHASGVVEMKAAFGPIISPSDKHMIVSSRLNDRHQSILVNAANMQVLESFDTIDVSLILRDINNDGNKDLFLSGDGKMRVRPYNSETGQFNKEIVLEGACFSPTERLVRGKFANKPIYFKYRWTGLDLLPIEYLYPHPDNANWLIKSDTLFQDPVLARGATLWYLPKDYRTVEECAARGGI